MFDAGPSYRLRPVVVISVGELGIASYLRGNIVFTQWPISVYERHVFKPPGLGEPRLSCLFWDMPKCICTTAITLPSSRLTFDISHLAAVMRLGALV
ncbi:unnamed protein product [Soboliphyme baturini]|uniref:Secreted protein n=1 Tax=Soboliphyme baturini TaxID=241478 RepID=A0A183INW8_9BILA|nr:unnamed protein product [Soboliphyme baturini]